MICDNCLHKEVCGCEGAFDEAITYCKDFLSVSTEKTAYWTLLDECSNSGYYCSNCLKKVVKEGWSETVKKIKFCPNCGFQMKEENKE